MSVQAVEELVGVLEAVVRNAEVHLPGVSFPYQCSLSVGLHENTFGRNAYTSEFASGTGKSCKAIATGFQKRGTFAGIAYHFLCEHVMAFFQIIGW